MTPIRTLATVIVAALATVSVTAGCDDKDDRGPLVAPVVNNRPDGPDCRKRWCPMESNGIVVGGFVLKPPNAWQWQGDDNSTQARIGGNDEHDVEITNVMHQEDVGGKPGKLAQLLIGYRRDAKDRITMLKTIPASGQPHATPLKALAHPHDTVTAWIGAYYPFSNSQNGTAYTITAVVERDLDGDGDIDAALQIYGANAKKLHDNPDYQQLAYQALKAVQPLAG